MLEFIDFNMSLPDICVSDTSKANPNLASHAPIVKRTIVNITFNWFHLIMDMGIARLMVRVKISRIRREVSRCFRFNLKVSREYTPEINKIEDVIRRSFRYAYYVTTYLPFWGE